MISAVAEIYKLHPQTLRLYERVGLLKPSRSQGNTRLYTDSDLERLDVILTLASNTALGDGVVPDKARIRSEFPYFGEPHSRAEQADVTPAPQHNDYSGTLLRGS